MDACTLTSVSKFRYDSFFEKFEAEFDLYESIFDEINVLSDFDVNIFVEDVNPSQQRIKKDMKQTIRNTGKTTVRAGQIYADTTDAVAVGYKVEWGVLSKLASLASKAFNFIMDKIWKLFEFIGKLSENILDLPQNIRDKITGSFDIYITPNDIQFLYSNNIPFAMKNFITNARNLVVGDTFTSFFRMSDKKEKKKESSVIPNIEIISNNDMKLIKNMKIEYKKFSKVNVTKRRVVLNDPKLTKIYFGAEPCISINVNGTQEKFTYYNGLKKLIDDIKSVTKELEEINTNLNQKIFRVQNTENWSGLKRSNVNDIQESVKMISHTLEIYSRFINYAMADMNTIYKNFNSIGKNGNKIKDQVNEKYYIGRKLDPRNPKDKEYIDTSPDLPNPEVEKRLDPVEWIYDEHSGRAMQFGYYKYLYQGGSIYKDNNTPEINKINFGKYSLEGELDEDTAREQGLPVMPEDSYKYKIPKSDLVYDKETGNVVQYGYYLKKGSNDKKTKFIKSIDDFKKENIRRKDRIKAKVKP